MTFSAAFILEKLEVLQQYRQELEELLTLSDDGISRSAANRHGVERLFQLLVDTMIDINQHFIKELRLEVPDDLYSTFTALGKEQILESSFATKLAPIVGVRNRLVHQYEKIDQVRFLKNLRENFADFTTYKDQIIAALEALKKSG